MTACPICQSQQKTASFKFSKYPITNIYLPERDISNKFTSDLFISQCSECAHITSDSSFDLLSIYSNEYGYNGASSGVSKRRNSSVSFLKRNIQPSIIGTILDIGCNNIEMLKLAKENFVAKRLIGIDPVKNKVNEYKENGIEYYNCFFSEFNQDIGSKDTNLIIIDNVLEHIIDIHVFLEKLNEITKTGDLIYICIPSAEKMFEKLRLHEIIHEHVHYFSKANINYLFNKYDFIEESSNSETILGRDYNFHLFKKIKPKKQIHNISFEFDLHTAYERYKILLKIMKEQIENINGKFFAVCASELTPTLAYHMNSHLEFCNYIYDSSPHKLEKFMPGIAPQIIDINRMKRDISTNDHILITFPNIASEVVKNMKNSNIENNIIIPTGFL